MKNENPIYFLASAAVIIGALMKILHTPYAELVFLGSFIGMILFQTLLIDKLKKKIKVLEKE